MIFPKVMQLWEDLALGMCDVEEVANIKIIRKTLICQNFSRANMWKPLLPMWQTIKDENDSYAVFYTGSY